MKAFELKGSVYFFNEEISTDRIVLWVIENLCDFGLNEQHSCDVIKTSSSSFQISGDEDFLDIDIYHLTPEL